MKRFPNLNNLKFKKFHKINDSFLHLYESKRFLPSKGVYALQSVEAGKLTFMQIESCRRVLRRGIGKHTFIWVRVFPYIPVSKKPIASRMGKGKGSISFWIAPVKKGQILFEIGNISNFKATILLKKAGDKLPVKTQLVNIKF